MTLKQLKEERKKVYDAMTDQRNALNVEGREDKTMTADERAAWDASNADFDRLNQEIADAERMERASGIMGQGDNAAAPGTEGRTGNSGEATGPVSEAEYRDALNGWARGQILGRVDSAREAAAMERCHITPFMGELRINRPGMRGPNSRADIDRLMEQRAMTVGTATEGAEFVPEAFVRQLEAAMLDYGAMLAHVTRLRTDGGNQLPWPTMNDTDNAGAMISENATAGSEAKPATSEVVFNAYKGTSRPVLVTQELIEDSAFDMSSTITGALGMRLGRLMNAQGTTGTGSDAPYGITLAATAGATATNAASIIYADILSLFYSVGAAYRNMPGFAFMFNDAIAQNLRLIQDGAGSYIFHGDLSLPTGERLLGKPVVYNQDMASTVEASAKTMIAGDLSKFVIREVRDIRVYRLDQLYRISNDADGFVAFVRFDSDLLDAGTHPVRLLTQAAGS